MVDPWTFTAVGLAAVALGMLGMAAILVGGQLVRRLLRALRRNLFLPPSQDAPPAAASAPRTNDQEIDPADLLFPLDDNAESDEDTR